MNNSRLQVSNTAIKQYFLLFLFMMIHGNRLLTIYNDIILLGVLFIGLLTIITRQSVFGKKNILFLAVLAGFLLVVSAFSSGSLMLTTVLMVLSRFTIAFLAYGVDKDNFVSRFIKMVYVLSLISLLGFALTQLIPDALKSVFPKYVYYYTSPWSGQAIARPTYYAGIFQFRADADISRNIGMFNEPGLHQIVLNTAIYFMLFYKEQCNLVEKKYKRVLLILLVTLITAQSATGLLGLTIIVIGYIFAEKKECRWKALAALVFLVFILIGYLASTGTDSWLYRTVLRKLISEDGSFDLMSSTGKSRIVSMAADLRVFIGNPIGNGTRYYESVWKSYLYDAISDSSSPVGLTSSLAVYGIFPVFTIWSFYIKNKWNNKKNIFDWFVCMLLIVNTAAAQPSIFFPCFIVMVLVRNSRPEVLR